MDLRICLLLWPAMAYGCITPSFAKYAADIFHYPPIRSPFQEFSEIGQIYLLLTELFETTEFLKIIFFSTGPAGVNCIKLSMDV